MELTYRHWFFISMLVLVDVIVLGCLALAVLGKVYIFK